jgi:hypothetical protein
VPKSILDFSKFLLKTLLLLTQKYLNCMDQYYGIYLSDKQLLFQDFLLQKLGFDCYDNTYMKELESIVSKLKRKKSYTAESGQSYDVPYSTIDFLYEECEFKSMKKYERKEITNNIINATDLAAYTFCPASYAIQKSFDTEKEGMSSATKVGLEMHEKQLLLSDSDNGETNRLEKRGSTMGNKDKVFNEFYSNVKKSNAIYGGHNQQTKKYFINKKGNFCGQPDFVFENKLGEKFIVEEKFKYAEGDKHQSFNQSHIIQVASYIYGLDEFNANYGYLVYWYYNWEGITECKVLKIEKSNQLLTKLRETYASLDSFIKSKKQAFDIEKISPSKCAKCVVSKFCGHKTSRFNDLELPYNDRFLKMEFTKYKKEDTVIDYKKNHEIKYIKKSIILNKDIKVVRKGWKYGYFDINNNPVTSLIYSEAYDFVNGLALVKRNWKYGFIDTNGKEVIPNIYNDANHFYEDLAIVRKDWKYGCIDKTGNEITPFEYNSIEVLENGNYSVKKDSSWGILDKNGKETIPCEYENINIMKNGNYSVKKDSSWGILDKNGNEIIEKIEQLSEIRFKVLKFEHWALVDENQNEITPFCYKTIETLEDGNFSVQNNKYYWGILDKTGKEVIPCIYDYVGNFSEGLASVKKDWKPSVRKDLKPSVKKDCMYGFIDKTGKEVIACIYDDADKFSEGISKVLKDKKWGFIDKTGKEVIPFIYDAADKVSEGVAKVKKDDKWGIVDKNGNEIVEQIEQLTKTRFKALKFELWALLDENKNAVTPFRYKAIERVTERFFALKDYTIDIVDENGQSIYQNISSQTNLQSINIQSINDKNIITEDMVVMEGTLTKSFLDDSDVVTFVKKNPMKGVINKCQDDVIFITINSDLYGIIDKKEIEEAGLDINDRALFRVGNAISVYLKKVLPNKLVLSLTATINDKHQEPTFSNMKNLENSIVEGTVTGIQEYGIFVSVAKNISGLLHIKELKELNIKSNNLASHFYISQKIKVGILSVDVERRRIALSFEGNITDKE